MSRAKARELDANLHRARPYIEPDMAGRVRHDTVWARALAGWKPGLRVTVRFDKP